jgi:hypothetical protein
MFMKRIFTLLAVALLGATTISHAQIQRGNVLVGSDLAGFQIGLKKGAETQISISPKAMWFIRDNIALGAYVNFALSTAKGSGTDILYGVGPAARYYVNSPGVNLLRHGRWFFEGNVGIEGTNSSNGNGSSVNTNGLGLGVGPGYAYFITPNVGLETLLKYNGQVGFGNQTSTSYLNLNLGFQIYLPGRATAARIMREEGK